jgi:hypothetical protein
MKFLRKLMCFVGMHDWQDHRKHRTMAAHDVICSRCGKKIRMPAGGGFPIMPPGP